MAKNIEPKLVKIGDYLKLDDDVIFTIPEYQRAYSWQIENCDKLWQDIIDYTQSDSKDRYFFGTIIVNCQENDTKYALIDGQQRTTTFLLLLKALLIGINKAIQNETSDEDAEGLYRGLKERRRRIMEILYKVEIENIPDQPVLKKDKQIYNDISIVENYSINEKYKTDLNTILLSYDYMEAKNNVITIPYKRKDNKYTNFFKNFKYFYEKVKDLSETQINNITKKVIDECEVIEIKSWKVEQAIDMFNSLNSDGLPLYDSDIISAKLYAVAEKNGDGEEFTILWKNLMDEIADLNIIGIDSVLMQKMYYQRAIDKEIVLKSGSINVTTPGLRRYYTEINKYILNEPIKLCKELINIVKIWKKISKYPVAQVLFKFNDNAKLFIASYLWDFKFEDIEEEKINSIFNNMLRLFTVLELVDIGFSSKQFKTFLFEEELKFIDKTISDEDITNDFNEHIQNNWSKEEIKNNIEDYSRNTLVYLNEFLFAKEKNISFNLNTSYDIEHIMPYSGKNIQTIQSDAGIQNEDEFKNIVNKLGNKILLEQSINRAIGNEWFRTKISSNSENGYIKSKYPIARDLAIYYKNTDKPYWKKEDIEKTTKKISERIIKFIFG